MANTQAIDHVLRQAVHAQDVPGVVAMAATDEGIIYEGAFGTRELGKDATMTSDTVVWIASMTKAITAAAAMQEHLGEAQVVWRGAVQPPTAILKLRLLREFKREDGECPIWPTHMHAGQPRPL